MVDQDTEKVVTNKEILQALKTLMTKEENLDENSISLLDYIEVMHHKIEQYDERVNCLRKKLLDVSYDGKRVIDYDDNEKLKENIKIDFRNNKIVLSLQLLENEGIIKENVSLYYNRELDDLSMMPSCFQKQQGSELIRKAGKEIVDLYKYCIDNCYLTLPDNTFKQKEDIENDSKFLLTLAPYQLQIHYGSFYLKYDIKKNVYDLSVNSSKVCELLENNNSKNLKEFLGRLTYDISIFPAWTREELSEKRNQEIEKKMNQSKIYSLEPIVK